MRYETSPRATSLSLLTARRSKTCSWTARARQPTGGVIRQLCQGWVRFRRASYLFYFDAAHLTTGGRAHSLKVARELIPRFLASGARVRIVSSAAALATYTPWTTDEHALLDGLARLEADMVQFDAMSDSEASTIERLERDAREIGTARGSRGAGAESGVSAKVRQLMSTVLSLQREEVSRAQAGLQRLAATLASLTEAESPKALVYFADSMRKNAGYHYWKAVFQDPAILAGLSGPVAGSGRPPAACRALPGATDGGCFGRYPVLFRRGQESSQARSASATPKER
jgi:hypothetical protein